jgi:hypothetical protein
MYVFLYLQLHESKKKGGQTHGAETVNAEGPKGHLVRLEDSSSQGRDYDVGACREACSGIPQGTETAGGEKGGAQMRGDGSTFLRGRIWWIAYSFRGHSYQESSRSTAEGAAKKLLRKRLKQVGKPNFVDPAKEERWTLSNMKEKIRLDYERKQNRSFEGVENSFKHLEAEEAFKFYRVVDITADKIQEYGDKRLQVGAARASVNYELACLRRGFKLMFEAGMISTVPVIKLYDGTAVRKGFIGVAEFKALLEKIEDPNVQDIVEFLYNSGWRSGEAKGASLVVDRRRHDSAA